MADCVGNRIIGGRPEIDSRQSLDFTTRSAPESPHGLSGHYPTHLFGMVLNHRDRFYHK